MPAKKKKIIKKKVTKKVTSTHKKVVSKKPAKKTTPKKAAPKKKVTAKKVVVKKAPLKKAAAKKIVKTPIKPIQKTKIVKPTLPITQKSTIKEEPIVDTTLDEFDFNPHEVANAEGYMDDEQLEYFRKILLSWRQQLMQEVDNTIGHLQEDVLALPDPIDRASQEEGFSLELRARDRDRKLMQKIASALDRIESGDYGYCEDCGADIGVNRLEARPTATKCIDCKTYSEIREKQAGN